MPLPCPEGYAITDTSQMSIEQMAKVTNATFVGYFQRVVHTKESFAAACRAWSLDVAQSVVLERTDGRMVGMAMLGARDDRGWCGGFGILPRYRGRGLGIVLAQAMVDRARGMGLATLQLEVSDTNKVAQRVFLRAGFKMRRALASFRIDLEQGARRFSAGASAFLDIHGSSVEECLHAAVRLGGLPGAEATWQREPSSIYVMSDLACLIAGARSNPRGVLIYRCMPGSGEIGIVLIRYKNSHVVRSLLKRASWDGAAAVQIAFSHGSVAKPAEITLINEPEGSPFLALSTQMGFAPTFRQYEMVHDLANADG